MKKIVTVITLLLAFTISANAQDKKDSQEKKAGTKEVVANSPAAAAKKDAVALSEFLGLNDDQTRNFAQLFEMKHEVMQDPTHTLERKKDMVRIVGLKLEASMEQAKFEKLRANTALYKQLTGENYL